MLLKNLKLVKGSQSLSVNLSDIKTNHSGNTYCASQGRRRGRQTRLVRLLYSRGGPVFLPCTPQVWVEKVGAGYYTAIGF